MILLFFSRETVAPNCDIKTLVCDIKHRFIGSKIPFILSILKTAFISATLCNRSFEIIGVKVIFEVPNFNTKRYMYFSQAVSFGRLLPIMVMSYSAVSAIIEFYSLCIIRQYQ